MATTSYRPSRSTPLSKLLTALQPFQKIGTSALALILVLAIWQLLCSGPDANLPGPITVVEETWDLIINPFF